MNDEKPVFSLRQDCEFNSHTCHSFFLSISFRLHMLAEHARPVKWRIKISAVITWELQSREQALAAGTEPTCQDFSFWIMNDWLLFDQWESIILMSRLTLIDWNNDSHWLTDWFSLVENPAYLEKVSVSYVSLQAWLTNAWMSFLVVWSYLSDLRL